MSVSACCLTGYKWSGTPVGHEGTLANNQAYITGDNPDTAILLIHDLLTWKFPNIRLLADHFAAEAGATVYVPDYFHGESLPLQPILDEAFDKIDIKGFISNHSRDIREPEIFDCARALRKKHGFKKIGAVGYCYGGWAVFRLGAKDHEPEPLVDCITAGHPTFLTKSDIDNVGVPVQMLAPEFDTAYPAESKSYTFETLQKNGIPFDYQHYPGVVHACFSRGDENKKGERAALVRGKNAVVYWMVQWLKQEEEAA